LGDDGPLEDMLQGGHWCCSLLVRGGKAMGSLRTMPNSKARFEMEVPGLGTRPRYAGSSQLE
jgi:hypothetical protein